jgi:hypothetical protein
MKQLLVNFLLTFCLPFLSGCTHPGSHHIVPAHARHIEAPGHTQSSTEKIKAVEIEEDDDVEQACKHPESTSYSIYSCAQPAAHSYHTVASRLSGAFLHSYTPPSRLILFSTFRI